MREGLRLRAIRQNWEPVTIRSDRRVPLSSSAVIWTSVSLPGDQSRPLGVLLGKRHEQPSVHICDNPRDRTQLVTFFAEIAVQLEGYIFASEPFYQLVVGDTADVRHLVSTALRAGKVGPSNPEDPSARKSDGTAFDANLIAAARRLGVYLAYPAIQRFSETHQAALVVLTNVLSDHIATAISDTERQNLAIHLAYAERGLDYFTRQARAAEAVKAPSDHRLLGGFDDTITTALEKFHTKDSRGKVRPYEPEATARDLDAYRATVEALLWPLRALHERAYDRLASFEEGGAAAAHIAQSETAGYAQLRLHIDGVKAEPFYTDDTGVRRVADPVRYLTGRQGVTASINSFVRQEHFHEADEAAMIRKDPIARACAVLDGKVVRGRVRSAAPIENATMLQIVTHQEIAGFEEGDEVEILDWKLHDPKSEYGSADGVIKSLALDEETVVYTLRIGRFVEIGIGAVVEIAEKAFAGSQIFAVSKKRLEKTSWTHAEETAPAEVVAHQHSVNRVAELFAKL